MRLELNKATPQMYQKRQPNFLVLSVILPTIPTMNPSVHP